MINLLTMSQEQEESAITTIVPWLQAIRAPYPDLSIPYGMPAWSLVIKINTDTLWVTETVLTSLYNIFMVNSQGLPACYLTADASYLPVNVANDSPLVQRLQVALNLASTISYSSPINARILIMPGQFKFLWLYEAGKVIMIDRELANVGTALAYERFYNYNDVVTLIQSNLLGLGT